jgi:hypothetical protein
MCKHKSSLHLCLHVLSEAFAEARVDHHDSASQIHSAAIGLVLRIMEDIDVGVVLPSMSKCRCVALKMHIAEYVSVVSSCVCIQRSCAFHVQIGRMNVQEGNKRLSAAASHSHCVRVRVVIS